MAIDSRHLVRSFVRLASALGVLVSFAGPAAAAQPALGGASADVSITKTDSPDPVIAGNNLTYTITVTNAGPSTAADVAWSDDVPAGTTFVSLAQPGGWSCSMPAVGAGGTASCSIASLGVGSAQFTLVVHVDAGTAQASTITNTADVTSSTTDPNPGNGSDTETTTVNTSADVSVTKTDTPDPVAAGANLTYTITMTNAGPSFARNMIALLDPIPAGTTFVSLSAPPGWLCFTPGVGGTAPPVECQIVELPPGNAVFTLVVNVNPGLAAGTVITNTATASSPNTPDPNPNNQDGTATSTVAAPANVSVSGTKTAAGTFEPGGTVTYTVVLTNSGTSAQPDNPGDEFSDELPATLALVSATATSGTAVANTGTNTVTWNGPIAAGASVTTTITATILPSAAGQTVSNQGTISFDANGDGTNESTAVTDDPDTQAPGDATTFTVGGQGLATIAALDWRGFLALAALLGAAGAVWLRRG